LLEYKEKRKVKKKSGRKKSYTRRPEKRVRFEKTENGKKCKEETGLEERQRIWKKRERERERERP